MIHKILVEKSTDVDGLKKLVRKKLMTGGAVVRISAATSLEDLHSIVDVFAAGAEPNGVQDEVLAEVLRHPAATPELQERLLSFGLPAVMRAKQKKIRGEELPDV